MDRLQVKKQENGALESCLPSVKTTSIKRQIKINEIIFLLFKSKCIIKSHVFWETFQKKWQTTMCIIADMGFLNNLPTSLLWLTSKQGPKTGVSFCQRACRHTHKGGHTFTQKHGGSHPNLADQFVKFPAVAVPRRRRAPPLELSRGWSSPVLPRQWYKEILKDGALRQLTSVQVMCWG